MDIFNGWANHATWNVALWIGNEQSLYSLTKKIAADGGNYRDLAEVLIHVFGKTKTQDKVDRHLLRFLYILRVSEKTALKAIHRIRLCKYSIALTL